MVQTSETSNKRVSCCPVAVSPGGCESWWLSLLQPLGSAWATSGPVWPPAGSSTHGNTAGLTLAAETEQE